MRLLKRFRLPRGESTGPGLRSVWGAVGQGRVAVVPERGVEGSRVAGCGRETYLKDRKGPRPPRKWLRVNGVAGGMAADPSPVPTGGSRGHGAWAASGLAAPRAAATRPPVRPQPFGRREEYAELKSIAPFR